MSETKPIDISSKLFLNVKESCLTSGSAALENAYQNEIGGISRFPGLSEFSTLFGTQPTYLHEWNGDLIAVSSSRVWKVSPSGGRSHDRRHAGGARRAPDPAAGRAAGGAPHSRAHPRRPAALRSPGRAGREPRGLR